MKLPPENKIPVAILGATGTVGQKFIVLLENHPWFEITELVASQRSAGKSYQDAVAWKQKQNIPAHIASKKILSLEDKLQSPLLFSGLDSAVAGEAEGNYAALGHTVISNSSHYRMDATVPLVIPEINVEHFELVKQQQTQGKIITNPNCSTIAMMLVLAPLHQEFGLEWLNVTTMQAISGAGYPGVSSLDILGNIVPFIDGEEEKIETEPLKILAKYEHESLQFANFIVNAQANRVPVIDGHTETLTIKFKQKPESLSQIQDVLSRFQAYPQQQNLPSAPPYPVIVHSADNRPQPLLDIDQNGGMSSSVGRIRWSSLGDINLVVLGHNTIRGAAGCAILNAEAYVKMGYLNF